MSYCLFFIDCLCRTVCLFLVLACVELSVFADDLCRTVCLFLQMACIELSVFVDGL